MEVRTYKSGYSVCLYFFELNREFVQRSNLSTLDILIFKVFEGFDGVTKLHALNLYPQVDILLFTQGRFSQLLKNRQGEPCEKKVMSENMEGQESVKDAPGISTTEGVPAVTEADAQISFDDGKQYWESVNADLDGIMGGFGHITKIDLQGSKNFLAKFGIGLKEGKRTVSRALETGAGIGRVTEGLLLKVAEEVDVVEPVVKFTAGLKEKLGVGAVYNIGLQDWQPATIDDSGADKHYDLIWNQWCLGHLTDAQLVQYLERCKTVLTPDTGLIVVKENISKSGNDIFDETDSSVTREDKKFMEIFEQAGLRLVKSEYQRGLPKKLYPVKMYGLKPVAP